MSFKLIVDGNIPFQVVKVLRDAGYDVVNVRRALILELRTIGLPNYPSNLRESL